MTAKSLIRQTSWRSERSNLRDPGSLRHNVYDALSLNLVILIRTVSNLSTMFSTQMSFPSSNIVYIAVFHQELLPFVYKIMPLFAMFIF